MSQIRNPIIKNNFNIIIQSYYLQTSKRTWSSDLTETDDMQDKN